MDKTVDRIAEILEQIHGIDINCYHQDFLKRTIEKRLVSAGFAEINDYADLIKENRAEAIRLLEILNVTFSEFFRNPFTFEVLSQVVLPSVLKNKKELRIWSSACAGGHEPYSIAIICDEIAATVDKKPVIMLFATDINPTELQKAAQGVYLEPALGNVSVKRLKKYFKAEGEKYNIVPTLKSVINFSQFDLLNEEFSVPQPSIFGNFDVVFCSNLLFYYKPQWRQHILNKISASIAQGGYLVTSETERGFINEKEFREVVRFSAVFRKM